MPSLEFERTLLAVGHRSIAGVDEVGRGSWAGPVVAAAVILPLHDPALVQVLAGVRDSKCLQADERERLATSIARVALGIGLGWASHHTIDRDGLSAANRRALHRAVLALHPAPDALLIDYFRLPECALPQVAVPHGDARSLSVAAASIVAKTVRDRWMIGCDVRYPGYGFAHHKGYGTASHRRAIALHGISPMHRQSFRPCREASG